MQISLNPFRKSVISINLPPEIPFPAANSDRVRTMLARCPHAAVTPLSSAPKLANLVGVAEVLIKDERTRMGLGSFKALGAAFVIACDAENGEAKGRTYVTASAGNHGLSVAAGAAAFGANARVYLAKTVPEGFAEKLRSHGAEVVRAGDTYEASMEAAASAANAEGLTLLSDSSWPGYTQRPHVLMEGYLALMAEVTEQIEQPPTHIYLQAGVGGLATASAAFARENWGDAPRIIVVEPDLAPALQASILAGHAVVSEGGVSAMGRLDCKEPSLIALKGLARDADAFMTITENEGNAATAITAEAGFSSTPSGTAGIAGLLESKSLRTELGLDRAARVLVILSEEPE